MKKHLLIIATAAIAVSCSNTDNFKATQESPIDFTGVFVEKSSKAVITSASDLYTPGFGVFGVKTRNSTAEQVFGQLSTETAGGTKVSYGTAWTYASKRYWDQEATRYDFFAYAPYNTSSLLGTVGWTAANPSTSFTISGFKQSTTVANMVDILTATVSRVGSTNYTNTVDFSFSHILSNINVKMAVSDDLKSDETDNPVSVTSVTLSAIKMDGGYAYNTTSSKYVWTLDATQTTNPATFTANNKSGKTVVFEGGDLPSIATQNTGTGVSGLCDLLFIPQTLPTADGTKYAINVNYKIKDETFSKTIYLNQFTNSSSTASSEWKPGYKYNYVLVIGPTPIVFGNPTIGSWTEETYTYTIQ